MSNETRNQATEVADLINRDLAGDISEGRDILEKQGELREKINSSNLLSESDKDVWNRKLESAQSNLSESNIRSLNEEFTKEQKEIKRMVDTYTRKVLDSKEEAFAVDSTRGIDTATDYLKWFETLSYSDKQNALNKLDSEIDERKELRNKLLKRFDRKDVVKMRRSEMKDKLKELEFIEENVAHYKSLLQKDAVLFHDINLYLEAFEDLTPREQSEWIRKYETEIATPRRELVEKHDELPARFRSSNFLKMPSRKKQEYLDMVEDKIEKEYMSQIKKIPEDIWSEDSKRFAIDDFMKLDTVIKKAQWLEFLPKAIKAEEKLSGKYKESKFSEVREMSEYSTRNWERARFEQKEQMLKAMEAEVMLLDTFKSILDKSVKDKVISEKTRDRYLEMYNDGTLSERRIEVKSIMIALSPRRSLLRDFEKLTPETRKKFEDFYERGHKARLEIYKSAKTFESEEVSDEKDLKDKNNPESLEQSEVMQIVKKLQTQAENNEQIGNLEKALGLHEAVLAMHPENELSKKKVDQLTMELDALETASDKTVLDAVAKHVGGSSSAQREIKYIKLSQEIIEDKEDVIAHSHGNERLGKQHTHLEGDSFESEVYEELVAQSGGQKVIDDEWEAKRVQKIDVGKLGTGSNDATQVEKDLKILSSQENLDNAQLYDSDTGKILTLHEAKLRLAKREERFAKKIGSDVTGSMDRKMAA
ncbi:hypothetical protein C0416_00490 [bacterium]|nr:hypothetical protein [bacterium]